MKALAYNPQSSETSFLQLIDTAKPKLTDSNAIIKVIGVGVCGSDLLKLNQGLVKPGAILGHEMVGLIDEISEELGSKYGLQVGDRIISSHHVPCLECNYCLNGQESLCTQFKSTNFNPGAFCEYLELSEAHLKHTVYKLPEDLSDEEGSFIEPIACCIKAAERSNIAMAKFHPKVLVIGLGSIGLIMGQVVKHYLPNAELTGLDLIEDRLKLAKELGFDKSISSLNHSYNYIFLCAGSSATVDLAIKHAANGATIVVFSSVSDQLKAFTNNDIYYKELTVLGSYSPNLANLSESLDLISSGIIKVQPLISQRSDLENLGETIRVCNEKQGIKTYLKI